MKLFLRKMIPLDTISDIFGIVHLARAALQMLLRLVHNKSPLSSNKPQLSVCST